MQTDGSLLTIFSLCANSFGRLFNETTNKGKELTIQQEKSCQQYSTLTLTDSCLLAIFSLSANSFGHLFNKNTETDEEKEGDD